MDWSGVDYLLIIVMFLSFWCHLFIAEDPLVRKWCNATFLKICSNEEKKNVLGSTLNIVMKYNTIMYSEVESNELHLLALL